MPAFQVTLEPVTVSPVIRQMHRHTRTFEAASLQAAQKMVKQAFANNVDWMATKVQPKDKP